MKLRGILELLLIVVLLCLSVKTDFTYNEDKAKNYIGLNTNKEVTVLSANTSTLSSRNNNDETIIEYVNESSSAVSIGVANIDVICHGSGTNKSEDEALVRRNINLSVYFSLNEKGERFSSIVVGKNEKVFIHIIKEYKGNEYPINDVSCEYNITT